MCAGFIGEDPCGDAVNRIWRSGALARKGEEMEVYIYGLILAGYLVLWFVSRNSEGRGIGRIAQFLYERGRSGGRRIFRGGFFEESAVRRDLALLYPYGRLEGEEKRFYVGRIRTALMILLAGDILAVAGYAAAEGNMLLQGGGLVREEIGGEDRSTELEAYIVQEEEAGSTGEGGAGNTTKDGGESSRIYQGNYHLEVRSRKLGEEQARSMAERVFALLPERILGENESLGHVTKPLDLPGAIEGYPFQIFWESSSYALIDSDGAVGNLGMGEGESRKVTLTAILSYGIPGHRIRTGALGGRQAVFADKGGDPERGRRQRVRRDAAAARQDGRPCAALGGKALGLGIVHTGFCGNRSVSRRGGDGKQAA